MTIGHIVQRNGREVISVQRTTSVGDAVRLLAEKRIGAVPVLDGDTVVGIFSERDLVYDIARHGAACLDWPVDRAMSSPAITVSSDLPILTALALITARRIRHLPVVDGAGIVGFVSIGDLVKERIDGIESEAAALRDYIQGA